MALDASPWGGDPHVPVCRSCGLFIAGRAEAVRVAFDNDPDGTRGYTGTYHPACSRPFAAMARVLNMKPFGS
jgi:hypothetical protein